MITPILQLIPAFLFIQGVLQELIFSQRFHSFASTTLSHPCLQVTSLHYVHFGYSLKTIRLNLLSASTLGKPSGRLLQGLTMSELQQSKACTYKRAVFTGALRDYPPEIRELIFTAAIESSGETPALIVALRGDKELYYEALQILYRDCTFVVTAKNKDAFMRLSKSAVATIQRFGLQFS